MDGDGEQISRMQGGVRAWVSRARRESGHTLRRLSPPTLLSLLSAAAFAPVITAASGVTGAAVVASIGVLSSVGGGVLGELISEVIDHLRSDDGGEIPPGKAEEAVAARIESVLKADNRRADALRAEIAEVLNRIDVGDAVLRTAIETANEQVRDDIVTAMSGLGNEFAEMRFLLTDVGQAAAVILESLDEQDTKLRAIIDLNSRQAVEARLTREMVAALTWRARSDGADGTGKADFAPRWTDGSPYRGLLSFDARHAGLFFGRERLVARLVGKLAERTAAGGLIIVTGASGAGKSSLLRAGLIPALARGLQMPGSDRWPYLIITPTRRPLLELATHLAVIGGTDATALKDRLQAHPGQAQMAIRQAAIAYSTRITGDGQAAAPDPVPLVLVIDQFEEFFTLNPGAGGDDERQAFFRVLRAAASNTAGPRPAPAALVIIAVRGDFLDRCAALPELADAMQEGQLVIGPMTGLEMRLAITGPADAAGLRIDAGLVETIVGDLRSAGRGNTAGLLPLLSQAMLRTWENREGNQLTSQAYARAGGVAHAVQLSADAVYEALSVPQRDLARDVLVTMTVVARDGQLTRRRVSRADLLTGRSARECADLDAVLESFAAKRLIVLNDETAEIAHDALLNAWPRLRTWLDDDRSAWILYSQLTLDASTWHDSSDDQSFLYRGTQLTALSQSARKWAAEPGRYPSLSHVERAFLDASSRASARSSRQRRAFAVLLVVLLIASATAAGVAVRAARNANEKANVELSGQLTVESEESDVSDPALASLLAAAAWQINPDPQAEEGMLDAVAQPGRGTWQGVTGVQTAALSPRGTILATGGLHGQLQLWDVATHRQIGATLRAGQDVTSVAFSLSGKILATASSEGAQLWDVATHQRLGAPIDAGQGGADSVAFSPDGKVLAISGTDVELWNVAGYRRIGAPLAAAGGPVAFSPDDRLLAVGASNGAVQLFGTSTGQPIGSPFGANGWKTFDVAFSPDGRTLATASDNSAARLWQVATHRELGSLQPGRASGSMYAVAFSPDGAAAATVNEDGNARLWDVADHRQLGNAMTAGVGGVMSDLAVSSAGTLLATVNQDGAIRLFDPAIYRQTGAALEASSGNDGFPGQVVSVTISPDGKLLATVNNDGTIRLWNAANHRQAGVLAAANPNNASPDYAAFSPNGKTLAVALESDAGAGDIVQLWDVATRRRLAAVLYTGFTNFAATLAFSPDSRILAVGMSNGKVTLLNMATGRQIGLVMTAGTGFAPKAELVNSIAFSPNGKTFATASYDGTVRLWDVANTREIGAPLIQTAGTADTVAFSPTGNLLATGTSAGTVQLWNTATRDEIGPPFTSNDGAVASAAFSPSGQLLATGDSDGTVHLWDVSTYHQIGPSLTGSDTTVVTSVAFSPNGDTLAAAYYGSVARTWDVAIPRDLPGAMCSIAGRSLTHTEWDTYIGSEPFRLVCP